VPGDQILLRNNMKVPCDCELLQGELLMNEIALNGESIPFRKSTQSNLNKVINFIKKFLNKINYVNIN
jgi:cation-transporting P-type ATPase 13A2